MVAVVDVLVSFFRWLARYQRIQFSSRLRAVIQAVKYIKRFQTFIKERREARITNLVRKWRSQEAQRRDKCRWYLLKDTETVRRLAHDYTECLVPNEMKYQVFG